ncbi:MAG: hypothetical protein FWG61_05955 [Firmicutes bacterium]|nr:hypothetical protein [Bacillota bacterium]
MTNNYNVNGLILWLKKRQHNNANNNSQPHNNNSFFMWGYYDYLSIDTVNEWSGFDLQKDNVNEDLANITDYHEEFPLKLVRPLDLDVQNEQGLFDYRENSTATANYPANDAAPSGPFIAVALISFSQAVVESNYKGFRPEPVMLNKFLQKELLRCGKFLWADKSDNYMKRLHCATYYSTGFGDMVIIFRTSRLDLASDLIAALRMRPFNDDSFILSTSYAICGIESNYDNAKYPNLNNDMEHMRLSVRFILKPGMNAAGFYEELRKSIREKHANNTEYLNKIDKHLPEVAEISELVISSDNSTLQYGNFLAQMYGNSDALISPNERPFYYLDEYIKGGLKPGNKFYEKYIAATRSSMRRLPQNEALFTNIDKSVITKQRARQQKQGDMLKKTLTSLLQEVGQYCEIRNSILTNILKTNNTEKSTHMRRGLKHTLELYTDLAQSDHSYDICCMLNPVMESFAINIVNAKQELEGLKQDLENKMHRGQELDRKDYKIIGNMIGNSDTNIEYFRHELNELLIDFSRADRQYIEGRTMLHPAIGSATKLILSYSRFLQVLIELLQDENYLPESTCSFFVSCGGAMNTRAKRLFKHIAPVYYNENSDKTTTHKLLQLRLTERALFRPGAAAYSIVHEALHYAGYKFPTKRAKKLVEAVVAYLANRLSVLCVVNDINLQDVLLGISHRDASAIIEKTEARISDKLKVFRNDLAKAIMKNIENYRIPPSMLASDELVPLLSGVFSQILPSRYCDDTKNLAKAVSKAAATELADTWRFVSDALAEKHNYPLHALVNEQNMLSADVILQTTHVLFDDLLNNAYRLTKGTEGSPTLESSPEGTEESQKLGHSLYDIIVNYMSAFREVSVDVLTCLYLNCDKASKYLFIFLCENESPKLALRKTPEVVFRLGGVLYLIDERIHDCFELSNDEDFDNGLNKLFAQAEQELIKLSLPNIADPDTVNDYITHIKKIIKDYRIDYHLTGIAQPLYDYLQECLDYHREKITILDGNEDLKYKLSAIRELFKCGLNKDAISAHKAWEKLLQFWISSALKK